jgi:hypothetical protein
MPAKKQAKKVFRPRAKKKAPSKKQKPESLGSQIARIGAQIETLVRRKAAGLTDAQSGILEKLPQMIGGLSGRLERIGKDVKGKEPRQLAKADRELLGGLQSEIQTLHEEVHDLKQMLEEMKSGFEQAASKPSLPAAEEQPKQEEEPKVG